MIKAAAPKGNAPNGNAAVNGNATNRKAVVNGNAANGKTATNGNAAVNGKTALVIKENKTPTEENVELNLDLGREREVDKQEPAPQVKLLRGKRSNETPITRPEEKNNTGTNNTLELGGGGRRRTRKHRQLKKSRNAKKSKKSSKGKRRQ
jgi:hypothetical protein